MLTSRRRVVSADATTHKVMALAEVDSKFYNAVTVGPRRLLPDVMGHLVSRTAAPNTVGPAESCMSTFIAI